MYQPPVLLLQAFACPLGIAGDVGWNVGSFAYQAFTGRSVSPRYPRRFHQELTQMGVTRFGNTAEPSLLPA